MIKVIKDLIGFKNLESDWNFLYEENPDYFPFQSYDYNYISWVDMMESPDVSLFIVCYYLEKEKFAGAIFPFYVDSKSCLRFINDLHTDYQTALIRRDLRTKFSFYEEVFMLLFNEHFFKRFFLDNIMAVDYLLPYFGHFNRNVKIYRTENYSLFEVKKHPSDKSYIDSMRHLTAKERNRLKNIDKKIVDVDFLILNKLNGTEYPESIIEDLYRSMIYNGIRTDHYFTPSLRKFIMDLYNKGLLSIALILDNGKVGSASLFYMCHQNNYLIQWVILYTEKKYNLWSKLKILEYFYNSGGGVINFGRGAYPYKIQHFRPVIQNLYCLDFAKTDGLRYILQVKNNYELLFSMIRRFKNSVQNKMKK